MIEILSQIRKALDDLGVANVCAAYDAIPVRNKGEYFVVIGAGEYEALTPIISEKQIYIPVKCDVKFTVYAPPHLSQEELYGYYRSNLEATIDRLCGLSCRLKSINTSTDTKLNRQTLTAVMKITCMKTIEREVTTENGIEQ